MQRIYVYIHIHILMYYPRLTMDCLLQDLQFTEFDFYGKLHQFFYKIPIRLAKEPRLPMHGHGRVGL